MMQHQQHESYGIQVQENNQQNQSDQQCEERKGNKERKFQIDFSQLKSWISYQETKTNLQEFPVAEVYHKNAPKLNSVEI